MQMSWEESVQWLRSQPDKRELVEACYFDDPLIHAAQRFWASSEWQAICALLPAPSGRALDMGAGRGISSYALSRDGWEVTALEPDPSDLVGAGAINSLSRASGYKIEVVGSYSEDLPFSDNTFDVVNCRQVLHHARDLDQTCREIFRVLKPGGVMLATRDHVLRKREDLRAFLDNHALHKFYGGENAFLLEEYVSAIRKSGLVLTRKMAPRDTPINYYSPMTPEQYFEYCTRPVVKRLGKPLTQAFLSQKHFVGRLTFKALIAFLNARDNTPGRLYSFLAVKPKSVGNH